MPADNRLQYAFNLVNAYPQSAEQENCTTVKQSLFTTPVHAQVASNINWLFFEAASCSCFKQIVDQKQLGFYWLFKQVCNATKIADYSLSRLEINHLVFTYGIHMSSVQPFFSVVVGLPVSACVFVDGVKMLRW